MHAGLKFIPLIIIGLAAIIWALPAAHTLRRPLDICAALGAISGLAVMLLGTLLTIIPDFFR
jgi:hypothetical protein